MSPVTLLHYLIHHTRGGEGGAVHLTNILILCQFSCHKLVGGIGVFHEEILIGCFRPENLEIIY